MKIKSDWLLREPTWLIMLLLIMGGVWGFVELAGEMNDGDTQAFDEWVIQSLREPMDQNRPLGPRWLQEVARDITGLGGMAVLALITLAAAGFLLVRRGFRLMTLLLVTTTVGLIISMFLKQFFSRPRPSVVPHLAEVYSSSFPSGHSMLSAIVYLTLASIVSASLKQCSHRFYVFAIAILITTLVGCSRVYLGVHYPTDVLAGWTAGLVWSLLAWFVTHSLQHQRTVEHPGTDENLLR